LRAPWAIGVVRTSCGHSGMPCGAEEDVMAWPADDGSDDLRVLISAARSVPARVLQTPAGALGFLAGYLAAAPFASGDQVESALRNAGIGPVGWASTRRALEAPPAPRRGPSTPGVVWRLRALRNSW
jgi:hypothetical protein